MNPDMIAVAISIAIALIMFILYIIANQRERGQRPHWAAEVYLYYNALADAAPPDIAKLTAAFNATTPTTAQIEAYLAAGGEAYGYGTGGRTTMDVPAGAVPTAGAVSTAGAVLYGAKPRRGTSGVLPFNGMNWFQPP